MAHDYDAQKAQTFAVYADLEGGNSLPDMADIDYFFVRTAQDADWRALADILSRQGFACEYIEDDPDADQPYLVASLTEQALSADGIWISEKLATQFAVEHGFAPDGWGFEA